jgi:hypothetical protein
MTPHSRPNGKIELINIYFNLKLFQERKDIYLESKCSENYLIENKKIMSSPLK